ncbi:MAG: arabinan endo-1,5-alpha-L-arabinosidase [Ferruginibacter sp.]
MKIFYTFLLLLFTIQAWCQPNSNFNDTLIQVHDPVITRQDSTYYIFCTGQGITAYSSTDMKHWKREQPVFSQAPDWAVKTIPGFKGHVWAPDISFHNGQYYLYYSVSAFGKNTSCIGVATNITLDPAAGNFKWIDHGKVIESVPGRDMWNAIDPNLAMDENNEPWLAFGSFWDGIKLVKMDKSLTSVAQPEKWFTIASRKRTGSIPDSVAGDAAIEGPFIYKHDKYFYLFTSFDYCCRGEKSTYKMMVGRSEHIQGPYVDKNDLPLNDGGGSLVLEGDKNWHGVGHNAVAAFNGIDYLIFHAYDANDRGRPKLRIEKITWVNDWPVIQ